MIISILIKILMPYLMIGFMMAFFSEVADTEKDKSLISRIVTFCVITIFWLPTFIILAFKK